ncbi:hypothetical protein E2562_008365 [Oryza meyeriana var. granulata]|uniref:Uncharacterized protein n=1 Tax=Oryza meyeriana var. granulata TaxID=110450 RepID=A0A6G1EHG6_9ORYZ|nr:hypothetical protein E2562_008365 [Oryza meyeriana var. granulata]
MMGVDGLGAGMFELGDDACGEPGAGVVGAPGTSMFVRVEDTTSGYIEVYSMVKSVSPSLTVSPFHFHCVSSSKTISRDTWTHRVTGS